ncbi:DUF397 domain-containing protein [Thermomonospora amylolytica]|uniref:DUF397 domain-containing protein n=1 Tax=Thermomonospora amylolytica TaxID=1411117 RepID=UPI000E6C07E8|nr:DUF397 domain-containing protein [Thermomonospora amylolytica]
MGIFPGPQRTPWRKSTHSGDGNADCVQVADFTTVVGIRDSKDPDGPVIHVTRAGLAGLLETARRA